MDYGWLIFGLGITAIISGPSLLYLGRLLRTGEREPNHSVGLTWLGLLAGPGVVHWALSIEHLIGLVIALAYLPAVFIIPSLLSPYERTYMEKPLAHPKAPTRVR